jgi:hypothetical protein
MNFKTFCSIEDGLQDSCGTVTLLVFSSFFFFWALKNEIWKIPLQIFVFWML